MNVISATIAITRLAINSSIHSPFIKNLSTSSAVLFRTTPYLQAEPLKKKKRLDPAIVRAREDRKKKKIEKQIRRLEKNAKQLKPIEECEVSLNLLDEKKKLERKVNIAAEVIEKRALLEKAWANYKKNQHLNDCKMLDRILFSQQKALDELRKESESLYNEAIQFDFQLIPFQSEGPTETPPIENYESVDGDYQDISKKWD